MSSPADAAGVTVAALGERGLIDRIQRRLPPSPPGLLVGIGDDAAVAECPRGALQVITTDVLVEGVHFDRRFSAPSDIGYKALAVNVSDVAAMGGSAHIALLSLMLPPDTTVGFVDGLLDGLLDLAGVTRLALVGGNVARSPGPLIVDMTVAGSVKPRRILRRSGARPGDQLYVTGAIGASAAGLSWLDAARRSGVASPDDVPEGELAECVRRHRRPEPRARIGALLGRTRAASACIDLSDGLADGIARIASSSGVGARVEASELPVHPGARAWFESRGMDAMTGAVVGGEDYELLFAVPQRHRGQLRSVVRESRGVPVTRIGELTREPDVLIVREGRPEPLPRGFAHF